MFNPLIHRCRKSLRSLILGVLSLTLTLWLGSCSSATVTQTAITLNFGATSMIRNALQEIDQIYQQEHPHIWLSTIFAGNGTIRAAVEKKEPFDGVLFANSNTLKELDTQGLIVSQSLRELVTTDMVVIARSDSALQLTDIRDLTSDRFKTVAMGTNSLLVGRYTHTILERSKITQAVESKAVWATIDVREVLRTVEQGEADVGITFLPEAKALTNVKVLATVPQDLYDPIRSTAAVLKSSEHPQEMQIYIDFLGSDRAQEILQKFGLRSL